jgi:hypothetical protein
MLFTKYSQSNQIKDDDFRAGQTVVVGEMGKRTLNFSWK